MPPRELDGLRRIVPPPPGGFELHVDDWFVAWLLDWRLPAGARIGCTATGWVRTVPRFDDRKSCGGAATGWPGEGFPRALPVRRPSGNTLPGPFNRGTRDLVARTASTFDQNLGSALQHPERVRISCRGHAVVDGVAVGREDRFSRRRRQETANSDGDSGQQSGTGISDRDQRQWAATASISASTRILKTCHFDRGPQRPERRNPWGGSR